MVSEMPIAGTATRDCVAYDKNRHPIGCYKSTASECLVRSSNSYHGWFWSLTRVARVGRRYFPHAHSYGFCPLETRKLDGIGAGWVKGNES